MADDEERASNRRLAPDVIAQIKTLLDDGKQKPAGIARMTGVAKRSVERIKRCYEKHGQPYPPSAATGVSRGRPRLLDQEKEDWLVAYLDGNPSAQLHNLATALQQEFDIELSTATIHHYLSRRQHPSRKTRPKKPARPQVVIPAPTPAPPPPAPPPVKTLATQIATKLALTGPVKTHPANRLVQIRWNGEMIISTTEAHYVWEHPYYPQFYIPTSAIDSSPNLSVIGAGDAIRFNKGITFAHPLTLATSDGRQLEHPEGIITFDATLAGPGKALAGLVRIPFDAVDQWFEEDTPIHVHPRDPFKRVDVLRSRRRVTVSVNGVVLADVDAALHLHETGLPCRYYLPLSSVDAKLLRPSVTRTRCPYKGEAEYFSVELDGERYEDLAWFYRHPTVECAAIADLVCFYNERVDISIDGVAQPRPETHFANKKPNDRPAIL